MLVKHKIHGIGDATFFNNNGMDLIKVVFSWGTKIYASTAINNGILELIDKKNQPNKLVAPTQPAPIANSKLDDIILKYVEDFKRKKNLPFVVKDSIPIVYFGNLNAYQKSPLKVVTIGLNPSLQEFNFIDNFGIPHPLQNPRFNTNIDFNSPDCIAQLKTTLNNYFNITPYKWFDKYEKLLGAIGPSNNNMVSYGYYGNIVQNTSIHVDIYSAIATNPTWGGLSNNQKNQLQNTSLFKELLDFLAPNVILISVNMDIFNIFFGNWNSVHTYNFAGNNRIIIKEKGEKIVINGTNMMGVPFGGMNEAQVKSIINKHTACLMDKKQFAQNSSNHIINKVPLLPLPLIDNFIIICDKNGEMQAQEFDSTNERTHTIDSSNKVVVFKYQLKVLSDTGYNSIAWTTLENWNNRLTNKFDSSLVGELWHHNRNICNFERAKIHLVKLGFSSDNIIDQTKNCFGELGIVHDF